MLGKTLRLQRLKAISKITIGEFTVVRYAYGVMVRNADEQYWLFDDGTETDEWPDFISDEVKQYVKELFHAHEEIA